jgi:phosphoribosyl-ATP pyrophosphohydrolase
MIIPSVDIQNGQAVQLRQGREKVLEAGDPVAWARKFSVYGEIAVVDLDAALGTGENRERVAACCREAVCRVGGGLRDEEAIRRAIRAGARKVMIGTAAEPDFLRRFPKEWLVVALDCREGVVVRKGWTESTGVPVEEMVGRLHSHCSGFLVTFVEHEGGMRGIPMERVRALKAASPLPLTVAGGVHTLEEIETLAKWGVDVQLGMALYTGRLDPAEATIACLDFSKGPLPTVVQDEAGQVLMVAFSTPESLRKALRDRSGWYFSRSRDKLWRKGETSGNVQELVRVRYDCDRDTLLFTVRPAGPVCHTGGYSCFGDRAEPVLDDLWRLLRKRLDGDRVPAGSYTARLFKDSALLEKKVLEEAGEFARFRDRENLIWEAADLIYFMSVLLAREGVSWETVWDELRGRKKSES